MLKPYCQRNHGDDNNNNNKTVTMSDEIIFYDIPSKDKHPRCWSLNPWKGMPVPVGTHRLL